MRRDRPRRRRYKDRRGWRRTANRPVCGMAGRPGDRSRRAAGTAKRWWTAGRPGGSGSGGRSGRGFLSAIKSALTLVRVKKKLTLTFRSPPFALQELAGSMPPVKRPAGKTKQALTEEQKQEIREAFDLFDTDGSGALPALWE